MQRLDILVRYSKTVSGFDSRTHYKIYTNFKHMKKVSKIKFEWNQTDIDGYQRVGAMYCFKRCDVNQT